MRLVVSNMQAHIIVFRGSFSVKTHSNINHDKPASHLIRTSHSDFRRETTCSCNVFGEDRPLAVARRTSSFSLVEEIVGMSTTTNRWTSTRTIRSRKTSGVAFH